MNLDELQSVQARERQSSDLQHLRASFYREVAEFVEELTVEREEAVEAADNPFSAPEVRRLSDDIRTTKQTVEAIYERRVGKVVKKASIAAAGMPVDDDGLTDEEAALFDDLVDRIEGNRERVLAALDSDAAVDSPPSTPSAGDPEAARDPPDGVDAADIMNGPDPSEPDDSPEPAAPSDDGTDATEPSTVPGGEPTDPDAPAGDGDPDGDPAAASQAEGEQLRDDDATGTTSGTDHEAPEVPGVPRTTVRITADVGEVVGADDRDYDLSAEDVVTLPAPNAEVLLDNDAAERLE
jgi:DNA replication factor GINS